MEGRYDKNALSQVVDGVIVETGGFSIFKDREKAALFRRLAAARGVIVLTDSDGAGFLIRSHLKGILPPEQVKQAYIPDVYGKERRKRRPGREGKLGVEGNVPPGAVGGSAACRRHAGGGGETAPAGQRTHYQGRSLRPGTHRTAGQRRQAPRSCCKSWSCRSI